MDRKRIVLRGQKVDESIYVKCTWSSIDRKRIVWQLVLRVYVC